MPRVHVDLAERSYHIHIAPGALSQLGKRCAQLQLSRPCAVVTDQTVAQHWLAPALQSLRTAGFDPVVIQIRAGEPSKSLSTVAHGFSQLARHRLERKSFVVALGGGVVGDLAGFLAATYLRGIPFVQVPTTLLAQVDSSVGGKVGVNLKEGKNLVGAFHQPKLVLCDLDTLQTLPPRELRAGLAEVIKYGIIYDPSLFRRLEKWMPRLLEKDPSALAPIIARSCAIKADVVRQDEKENGLRAILNFGHTIGHALEAISGYGKYLHGEAISIGQVAAAQLSTQLSGLPHADLDRIRSLFRAAQLPVAVRLTPRQQKALLQAIKLDKKVSRGTVGFVLAERIGIVVWNQPVPEPAILNALPTGAR